MKKLRITAAGFMAAVLTCFSVTVGLCATIYNVGGYSYSIINNSEIALCGWDNRTNVLSVPDEIAGRKMVEISKYGLEGNDGFSTLDFSQAVNLKTIGYGGFLNCTSISNELIIPQSISVIGFSAFENCISLPSVMIEADVSAIQKSTFKGCLSLERVEIKGYTQSIGYMAFANCPKLSYVEIPEYVSNISPQAFDNSPNVVISCYYNSYAYHYAKDNSIPYILLDGGKLGDANGDGYVNVNDVTAIQRHAAELEPLTGICFHAADIDGDGDVSVDDATELQRFLAEYVVDYPIGEVMTQ